MFAKATAIQILLESACDCAQSAWLLLNEKKCAAIYKPILTAKTATIIKLPLFIDGIAIPIVK